MRPVISDDPAERHRAYAASHVRIWHPSIGELVIEPRPDGAVVGEFPEASEVTVHVVTAQNPGRLLSDDSNAARQERLEARLRPQRFLEVWRAEGGDQQWVHREASFAIVGLTDDEARSLGREFEQEAVFAWRSDELVVLSCDTGESVSLGWSVSLSH
jgi:hypothetical protein